MSAWPSPRSGTLKLAWFMMLKNSARNCRLKSSEILRIFMFLYTEKSRFIKPGPINLFLPELPRRLKHRRSPEGSGPPKLGGAGSQFAVQKVISGAVGTVKQFESGLMYRGWPLGPCLKFVSIGLHPATRLAYA